MDELVVVSQHLLMNEISLWISLSTGSKAPAKVNVSHQRQCRHHHHHQQLSLSTNTIYIVSVSPETGEWLNMKLAVNRVQWATLVSMIFGLIEYVICTSVVSVCLQTTKITLLLMGRQVLKEDTNLMKGGGNAQLSHQHQHV